MSKQSAKSEATSTVAVSAEAVVDSGESSVSAKTVRVTVLHMINLVKTGPGFESGRNQISSIMKNISIAPVVAYGVPGFSVANAQNNSFYFVPLSNIACVEQKDVAVE